MLIATVKELHSSLLDYYLFSHLTLAHSHSHQCFLDNPSWSLSLMLLTYRRSYILFLISTTLPFLLLTLATWSFMPFPKHTVWFLTLFLYHISFFCHPSQMSSRSPLPDSQTLARLSRPRQSFTSSVGAFLKSPRVSLTSFYAVLTFVHCFIVILSSLSISKSRFLCLHHHP